MTVRTIYDWLLRIHPPEFQRRFRAEMLCLFDQAAPSRGGLALIFDGLVSVARQWLRRSASWMVAAAVVGACLQLTAGGLIWIAIGDVGGRRRGNLSVADTAALDGLMRLIVGTVVALVLMVPATVLWMRSFGRKRTQRLRTGR